MPRKDPRVDEYIAAAAPFARPILRRLRAVVHRAAPDVVENMKWRMPFFERSGNLCCMAGFKAHCAFVLWQPRTGHRGVRRFGQLKRVEDLPSDKELIEILHELIAHHEKRTARKAPRKPTPPKKPLALPSYFKAALAKNARARTVFDQFPPGKRREYIAWITEAKTDATRERRLQTAIEWIAEGKSHNWKYEQRSR